jgi:hypothetical protein
MGRTRAQSYYLVAYGHVMRISERVPDRTKAALYCFGVSDPDRITAIEMTGKLWKYLTQGVQREYIIVLARLNKEKTGNILTGCEKEVKDVRYIPRNKEDEPTKEDEASGLH